MFSSAKYSSGQMLLFGLMILIPNLIVGIYVDKPSAMSMVLCAIGLNYVINAFAIDPKEKDEREDRILLESLKWTWGSMYFLILALLMASLFDVLKLGEQLNLAIVLSYAIVMQAVFKVYFRKYKY